jgi:hypothetical protein
MQHGEPGFTDTPPLPSRIEDTLVTDIPTYDNPDVDRVGLYDAATTAWALGMGGGRDTDEAFRFIGEHVTLAALVGAAAREAQNDHPTIDEGVIRSATAVLGAAIQQRENLTGSTARAKDEGFAAAAKILLKRYDRNLNPKQQQAHAGQQSAVGVHNSRGREIERQTVDPETQRELGEIIGRVSAFGFHGKVTPGTHMQMGRLPDLDVCNPKGYGSFAYPSRDGSPLVHWLDTRVTTLSMILRTAKNEQRHGNPGGIAQDDNHFFTYYRTGDGNAWVVFGRNDSSHDADWAGRPPGIQSAVFEMPERDATHLEALIRQNPMVFPAFITAAAPGLDRPVGMPARSPGMTADRSRSVTIINYDTFSPTVESQHTGRGSNKYTPFFDGKFYERWPAASRRYEYPTAV